MTDKPAQPVFDAEAIAAARDWPKFILFDGRAKTPKGSERATILDTAASEAEAKWIGIESYYGQDAIWYEHRLVSRRPDGTPQVEGWPRWDIPPNGEQP